MSDSDELRTLTVELKKKFEGDEAGAGSAPLVARTMGLAALVADQHTKSLVQWTRVMAFATILLSLATLVLAAPESVRWLASRQARMAKPLSISCTPAGPEPNPFGGNIVFVIDTSHNTAKVVSQLPFFDWSRTGRVTMTEDFIEVAVEDAGSKAVQRYSINRWGGSARDNEMIGEVRGRSFSYTCMDIGGRSF